MKKLTKMLAMVAAASSMQFAHAESGENDYKPVAKNGQIEQISIVNGQLEVRSSGDINGVKVPYAYVGTNTEHFAENAFAKGGLDKVDSYVHVGNGEIYITKKGDVYKTQIKKAPAALNGVTGIEVVSKANEQTTAAQNAELKRIQAEYPNDKVKMFDGEIYKICITGDGYSSVGRYDANKKQWDTSDSVPNGTAKITDYVKVGKNCTYALCDDGRVYGTRGGDFYEGISATSIALAGDKQTVILTANGKETLYNGVNGQKIETEEKGVTTLEANQYAALAQKAQASGEIVSAVKVGDTTYYATAKKLGWFRERN